MRFRDTLKVAGLTVALLTLLFAVRVPGSTVAQVEPCSGVVQIANGGFESPVLAPGTYSREEPDSWDVTGDVLFSSPPNGVNLTQAVELGGQGLYAAVSQQLIQSDLPGASVTLTIVATFGATVTLGRETRSIPGNPFPPVSTNVTFVVPPEATLPLVLTLSDSDGPGSAVEKISGTFTKGSCPTPTPTPTPSPTVTPDPIGDRQLTVTGDPRFPIIGSAAFAGVNGLTYSLNTPPIEGSVVVAPDGSFTYTAFRTVVNRDGFTVLVTDGNGDTAIVTVAVVFDIDASVPTYGTVKPGRGDDGSGGDGGSVDPRSTTSRTPTPSADAHEDSENDSCARCD